MQKLTTRIIVIILICLVSGIYCHAYSPQYGYSKLIYFGSNFFSYALPQVKTIPVYVNHNPIDKDGYDGQFYAQISIDPTLKNPAFNHALDFPIYRSRRIFLPVLVHILAFGNPAWIIQIYSVINFFFWLLLIFLLLKFLPDNSYRSKLCLIAAALNVGVIDSISRALTDLPSTSISLVSILVGSWRGAGILSLAILTREVSIFSLAGLMNFKGADAFRKNIILFFIAIFPMMIWFFYISLRFPKHIILKSIGQNNFYIPFISLITMFIKQYSCVFVEWHHLTASDWIHFFGDANVRLLFTMLSILTAAIYLITHQRMDSNIWKFGIAFVLVSLIAPWQEAIGRLLLPLMLSFYILLASEKSKLFFIFFFLASLNLPFTIYSLLR